MTERFTISLDAGLARQFDRYIRAKGYDNRSEAVRDLLRHVLEHERLEGEQAPFCIAALSYVYNHHERDLAERVVDRQHEHHDLCVSTMHAHLDHDNCLETVILRGPTRDVRRFAEALIAERGIRHGSLNMVPADLTAGGHRHVHSRPKT
jgi:CopG family nickel-responsive transcriptional regulator